MVLLEAFEKARDDDDACMEGLPVAELGPSPLVALSTFAPSTVPLLISCSSCLETADLKLAIEFDPSTDEAKEEDDLAPEGGRSVFGEAVLLEWSRLLCIAQDVNLLVILRLS
jgi:hypothetical protein